MTNKDQSRRDYDSDARKRAQRGNNDRSSRGTELRDSRMMAHLLDALESGTDIGHYGRLTFVMVARHFMNEADMVKLLAKQPDIEKEEARLMVRDVQERNYNPPSRERILEWMEQQDFPICPDEKDPGGCNVYRELQFPEEIYDQIEEFREEQYQADED